jgi:hypothetical protein
MPLDGTDLEKRQIVHFNQCQSKIYIYIQGSAHAGQCLALMKKKNVRPP